RPALVELVKIDLERQWRSGRRPCLEAYLKFYPELGTPEDALPDLLLSEYEARRRHGASADLADFARRFPRQADQLRLLVQPAPSTKSGDPAGAAGKATLLPVHSTLP